MSKAGLQCNFGRQFRGNRSSSACISTTVREASGAASSLLFSSEYHSHMIRYRTLASFECVGCLDLQSRGGKPLTTRCKHECNVCKDCASRMVSSAVTSGGWDSLKCPVRECKAELEYEDVRKVAAKVDFNRYLPSQQLQLRGS